MLYFKDITCWLSSTKCTVCEQTQFFTDAVCFFKVGVMVKDIFPELRLDVPNIEKQIAPNMLCLRDIEVLLHLPV